ncbi:MAG TPA: ATP-dependent DNA helicase [Gammaproteobacteria bacterium]|nr:ATP-dependent DNA helicase [Gammaproteobacteria bacterium]
MNSKEIFGTHGLLSEAIDGFSPRDSQQLMAEAVEKALMFSSQLIIEAGTGTGKTFAYLVPLFLAQKKTIISTGTKNLQDQLFFKDIPIIKKILPFPIQIVLLKGRANYLCKYRLERNLEDGRFISRQLISELQTVNEWAGITHTGDISELTTIAEDSLIWPYVTSTPDNCLGQECQFYKECFVVKARQQALAAEIVVVNHHLFFADMVLQEEGFGELLPGADAVVFDEAHQLPEMASQFFSTTLTGRQLIELARDTEALILQSAKDSRYVIEETDKLQAFVHEMRLALGQELRRAPWPELLSPLLKTTIQHIQETLQILEEMLKVISVRSKGLENCWRRTVQLIERFGLLTEKTPDNTIHWFETFTQSFTLQLTPMIVAENFKRYIEEKKRTWIFTSATLTVKNTFRLFVETLGLSQALQLQLKSPFDYKKQSLLYVPRELPDSRHQDYVSAMIKAVIPVLDITQGKAFLLFTSYKAMEEAAELLKNRIPYPLLVQGSSPKKALLEQFKSHGNAVLLGTNSFWYGVDVRGDALSCVMIDKLPFATPEDPILKARIQMFKKQGIDAFQEYQLPQAILMLKQGAGRLIRCTKDYGILMICDPRLAGARYGEDFLHSLPDMPRTRDIAKVQTFWQGREEVYDP